MEATAADKPADAWMGGARVGARPVASLREPSSRRLRRLRLAHERMARRSGSGTKRARRKRTGADETLVRVKGVKTVVGVVADAETGEVLGQEALVERDADGFMEWLGDFARGYGVEAMVADDLSACKPAVERLEIDHQICIACVKKWTRNRLDRIDGRDWVKARIWRLLTELPFNVDSELLRLERAVRDGDATLRRLCVELSGKWRALLCHSRRWTFRGCTRAKTGR